MRTWGRRGQTPVLPETFNWQSRSRLAGRTLWRLDFRIHPGSIKSPQVVEFLPAWLRHRPGKLLVIWDGAPIPRSALVRAFEATQANRRLIERLPADAPELNPVEYRWANLKEHELGNGRVRHAQEWSHHAPPRSPPDAPPPLHHPRRLEPG